jgi:hypothetical protein
MNSVGTMMYGRESFDPQTRSYISTLFFVALFVPIFPLACYRVTDGKPSGWHFLGGVPFGRRQKWHLAASCILIAVLIVYNSLASSSGETKPVSASPAALAPGLDSTAETLRNGRLSPMQDSRESAWEGTVVNSGMLDQPAKITITFDSLADTTTGSVYIKPPLGGSGRAFALISRAGNVRILSFNSQDTIGWEAHRIGDTLRGRYTILGGPYKNQRGTWNVTLSNGVH